MTSNLKSGFIQHKSRRSVFWYLKVTKDKVMLDEAMTSVKSHSRSAVCSGTELIPPT